MGNEIVAVVYTVIYCRLSWENKADLYIIVVVSFSFCKTSQKLENGVTFTDSKISAERKHSKSLSGLDFQNHQLPPRHFSNQPFDLNST